MIPGFLLALLLAGGEEPPAPPPAPPPPPTAAVVAAVAKSAAENAALPEGKRETGDALLARYVRAAAAAADGNPRALLLGLAHAADPHRTLERFNLTRKEFEGVETDGAREARLAALGKPTLRGRADHALHFLVSAGIAIHSGGRVAETVAFAKERLDAVRPGGTGISFADLLADLAGIRLAAWLAEEGKGRERTAALAAAFDGEAFMPDASGEKEGLTLEAFEKEYGSFMDERFLEERKRMVEGIEGLKAYRSKEEEGKVGKGKEAEKGKDGKGAGESGGGE